ncbi:DUF7033 domain-containing protein [Flavihumibacter petaseus]|uniref:DUF7033 domain-containing protein n=1 Tax=Flavihumibacter petaseus NBRC 106054 TaxID=1220578 RepID=A0A0E9MXH7_9BACT|nr:hypothetical protein [Flavihumibacter petaseus]GAO41830.1 hypothetical protein FPE01S_01_08450 [Flavihumibacter petaseus NBRC 106054]
MLIYAKELSPRLHYMIDFLNREIFVLEARLTTDLQVFHHYEGARINYSPDRLTDREYHIVPVGLLAESDLRGWEISCFRWEGLKAFFATQGGDLPFDILSAIFYLISRYEEYLTTVPDSFGRFHHVNSLAYREGFLHEPLVNYWLVKWQSLLQEKFPEYLFRRKSFKFIPTYDIDMMYAYAAKGWYRTMGGIGKHLLQGDLKSAWKRINVLRGKEKDPYDAYEWLDALHLYCRSKPVYFFLVAKERQGVDRNIPTDTKAFQELIHYYAATYKIGVHPSWQSSVATDGRILKEELEWLEAVADVPISKSRQHFLKFSLPLHYERLLALDVTQEFSMGYGTTNGFRASICSSYNWFNLAKNESTELTIYPFCFMDANALYEQKLNPQEAYAELMRYYAAVKKVQGCFITIWHNNFLGTDPAFIAWRNVYELFMKEDAYWDAD